MIDFTEYEFTTDTFDGETVLFHKRIGCDAEIHIIDENDSLAAVIESALAHAAECTVSA